MEDLFKSFAEELEERRLVKSNDQDHKDRIEAIADAKSKDAVIHGEWPGDRPRLKIAHKYRLGQMSEADVLKEHTEYMKPSKAKPKLTKGEVERVER